jgi:hypothetical protein
MRPAASCPLARLALAQPRLERGLTGDPVLPEALEAFHIETPKAKANKSLLLYVTAPPIDPFLFQLPNFPTS